MSWQAWLKRQFVKVLIWAVFVVGFALLPLIALYINASVAGAELTAERLYGAGELLLVVAAVAADTIGRLILLFYNLLFPQHPQTGTPATKEPVYTSHFVLLILAGVLAGTATMAYMSILTRLDLHQYVQVSTIIVISQRFLVATLMIGGSVILILED
jgi:hypothetical protein